MLADETLAKYEREKYITDGLPQLLQEEYEDRVKEKMTAVSLLKRAGDDRYVELKLSIRDQFSFGMNVYPKMLNGAYDLLENHSTRRNLYHKSRAKSGKDGEDTVKSITHSNEEGDNVKCIKFSQKTSQHRATTERYSQNILSFM